MAKRHLIALGFGGWLTLNEKYLKYTGYYGKGFRVRLDQIETATVEDASWGKGYLKIIGKGTELAKTKMPMPWAHSCQDWILDELKSNSTTQA